MAFTATTLKNTIQSYLQSTESDFVTYQDRIILQAEDRISKAVILPANRTTSSPTITANVSSVSLPEGFLAPFSFQVIVSGIYTTVAMVDTSFMREAYPDPTATGTPKYYAMSTSSTFIVAPTPTSGITSLLTYFYKPESITTADTSWLGTNAENCLLYACLSEAYTYLKGDPDLQKLYEEKYQMALADLRTLGEGMDMGDSFRWGERRVPR